MNLIYLASPYSKYPGGRQEAYDIVCKKAAELMLEGHKIFCPIAHSHAIEQHMSDIQDGEFWLEQDFAVLYNCNALYVYQMPGWQDSVGVIREIAFAHQFRIPVTHIEWKPVQLEINYELPQS